MRRYHSRIAAPFSNFVVAYTLFLCVLLFFPAIAAASYTLPVFSISFFSFLSLLILFPHSSILAILLEFALIQNNQLIQSRSQYLSDEGKIEQ